MHKFIYKITLCYFNKYLDFIASQKKKKKSYIKSNYIIFLSKDIKVSQYVWHPFLLNNAKMSVMIASNALVYKGTISFVK